MMPDKATLPPMNVVILPRWGHGQQGVPVGTPAGAQVLRVALRLE